MLVWIFYILGRTHWIFTDIAGTAGTIIGILIDCALAVGAIWEPTEKQS
jgi:hypothetical protein